MSDDRFLTCLPFTLAQECPLPNDWSNPRNFSNDAHDPGGKTMCGIIQREYDAWQNHHGAPTQDVRNLPQDTGYAIYQGNYWLPYCPKLPVGMDMVFFDAAVNEGVTEAVKIMQYALGINNDGQWGTQTDAAVARIADVGAAIRSFTARRETVYREMNGFQYFGGDWIRRSAQISAHATAMVSA